jgi:hypothetical protein
MIFLVNQKQMASVARVSVRNVGMNNAWTFLDKSEGPHVRAAKPTIMTVMSRRRRGEDFFGDPAPCDMS